MRICNNCNIEKPLSEYRDNRKKCKVCYNQKRYGERKERVKTDIEFYENVKRWDREKMARRRSAGNELFNYKEKCRAISRSGYKKNFKESSAVGKLLGCDWRVFREYIQGQFSSGMTWENHSFDGWHIDHIIPIDFGQTFEEVTALCHYTNLQPLWALDNWEKGNKAT